MKKVAVVGAGHWGRHVVRVFHETGALAAVVEASASIREQLAAEYPRLAITDSYAWILSSDIDAVIIATPVATHYRLAREALEHGKDVFVEKPMTVSAAEAEELQELALRQGRVLMVGHLLLYQSAIQWIKEYVASGELGELHSVHQRRIQLGRVRSTENVLWSLGVHDLAVLLYLVGEQPVEIRGTGQRILQSHVEDDVYVHLAFRRGVHAHLHVSWLWPKQERQTIVVGSRGMLEYRELEQTVILHRKTALESLTFRDDGSEVVFQGDHQPLRAEAEHFLHCLGTRRTPRSDGRNGVEVIRILEQATQMMKEGYGR